MEMAFIATADAYGSVDCSLCAGPPGFIEVMNERCSPTPNTAGNGVMASLGNISENPNIGLLLVDFVRDRVGPHVNGRARIVEDTQLRREFEGVSVDFEHGRTPERWVVVDVEAYIHCRKHIPRMQSAPSERAWGTDDVKSKGGDFFGARGSRLSRS
jgi:hypothetical protein